MCGIAGVVSLSRRASLEGARAISDAQAHRGPDGEGLDVIDCAGLSIGLGHRRLAILDLSPSGAQPMRNHETGDTIVFNGEIYNFSELRRELDGAGHTFVSRSDTEVLLHAYAEWGTDAFARLNGMFALAILDLRRRKLVFARDRFGIKPLYHAWGTASLESGVGGPALAFGSEVLAVVASGLVGKTIDSAGLATALAFGAVQEPTTIARDVTSLETGTWAEIDLCAANWKRRALQPKRYWSWANCAPTRQLGDAGNPNDILQSLRASVRSHLVSDRPLGVFLSSGVDSTAIATLCAEVRSGDIDLLTVERRDAPDLNEGPLSRRTAARLGARHKLISLSDHEALAKTEGWFRSLDQPTVDGLNTFIVASAAREAGIVVALSGLGSDEIFGGYGSFARVPLLARLLEAAELVPARVRASLSAGATAMGIEGRWERLIRLAALPQIDIRDVYFANRRLLSDRELTGLGFRERPPGLDRSFVPMISFPEHGLRATDLFFSVSVLESRYYMGNMLLRDADVFGMRNGVEIRVPFLGREITDAVFRLSGNARRRAAARRKALLLDALGERLPTEISRRSKTGFSLPYEAWMSGPLRDASDSAINVVCQSGLFEPRGVRTIWDGFLMNHQKTTWSHAWVLVVLGRWLERWRSVGGAPHRAAVVEYRRGGN